MFLITHAASAVTAAAVIDLYRVRKEKPRWFSDVDYCVIGFCSLIPDLFWPDGYGLFDIGMTITHSLFFGVVVFAALLLLSRIFYRTNYLFKTVVFWLAYLSHMAWDCVSGHKALFYPLSDAEIGITTLPITYWFILDIFLLVLMVVVLWLLKRMESRKASVPAS